MQIYLQDQVFFNFMWQKRVLKYACLVCCKGQRSVGLHSQHSTHKVTALLALHVTATTEEYAFEQSVSTKALFMFHSKCQ